MLEHSHKSKTSSCSPNKSTNNSGNKWLRLYLILKIMRNITTSNISRLCSDFHGFNEMKYCSMQRFDRHVCKDFSVSNGKVIHRVDVICSERVYVVLLETGSSLVNLVKSVVPS